MAQVSNALRGDVDFPAILAQATRNDWGLSVTWDGETAVAAPNRGVKPNSMQIVDVR